MTQAKLVLAALLALSAAACSNSKPDERKEAPATKTIGETPYVDPTKPAEQPPEPAPEGSAAGSATTMAPPPGADLPQECQDYKAMVDKMNACEKFGAQKAKLAEAFAASWTAWEKLPADGKAKLAAECKQSAATIQSVGAAACQWK